MGRHTKPKDQYVYLHPVGKGKHKVFDKVERRVDRRNIDCIVGSAGLMPTAKLKKGSPNLAAALLTPRKGHEMIELSKRGSASAAEALRKEKKKRAKLPSQQNKHGIDYSKPLPKSDAKEG